MSFRIRLHPFDKEFECEEGETVLAAALRQGIHLRYGCRQGGCGTCKAQILEGEVDAGDPTSLYALMDFERQQGFALLCEAVPVEDLEIDLSDYEEGELFQTAPIRDFTCEVSQIERLTRDLRGIRVRLVDPPRLEFRAGQYMDGLVPGTDQWRCYSMAGPPSRQDELEFILRVMPDGIASKYVDERLSLRERVLLRGPYGQFQLRPSRSPAVLVAGGSGIAPILSILREMAEQGESREMVFFYGARAREDLFNLKELEAFSERIPGYRFVAALSDPAPGDDWSGDVGLVTDVVLRHFPSLAGREAYLCGPPGMIDAALEAFPRSGIRAQDIVFDKFLTKADMR